MTSKIEWTTDTWNIITGCSKHSEGCQNCYAASFHKRLAGMKQKKYQHPFNQVIYHSEELNRVIGKKKLVFVNSMSDTFHESIDKSQIDWLLTACKVQPFNQFQILTKRAERLPSFKYPENVWLGTTVEMAKYKQRIDFLRKTDAKIKFLSCEPLLEDLGELDLSGIHWVIVGGESGPHSRPMHINWVRNILRQCREQNVAFFFKQWGMWCPYKNDALVHDVFVFKNSENKEKPDKDDIYYHIGKKYSGSMLDGKEYKEYPAWTSNWQEK